MNRVDITLSVLLDNAVLEYQKTTDLVINQIGIPQDLAEVAMEKALQDLKDKKMTLYATALYASANTEGRKKEVTGSGTPEDLMESFRSNGILVEGKEV